jgi:hypothetical protein
MKIRRSIVALLGASVLVAGCGSDLPTKSEFSSKVKESMGSDLKTALTSAGASASDADKAINDFIGCTYDKIKGNEDLLNQAYDDSGDKKVQDEIEKSAKACTSTLTSAMTEAAGG